MNLMNVDKMASNTYTNNYYHTMFEMQKGFNVGLMFFHLMEE